MIAPEERFTLTDEGRGYLDASREPTGTGLGGFVIAILAVVAVAVSAIAGVVG